MIEVYRIPFPKDRLGTLRKDERVLLLLLGYVSNQVLMWQKLLIYATKLDPEGEIEQHATGVQTQMLVRIAVSAAFESWRVVELRFLKNRIKTQYMDLLDDDGCRALDGLKRLFGKSSLLSAVRNNSVSTILRRTTWRRRSRPRATILVSMICGRFTSPIMASIPCFSSPTLCLRTASPPRAARPI
jgi:hypothetical protein